MLEIFQDEVKKNINSEDLVLGNLRLVFYWADKYYCPGLERSDLIQEGNIGLIEAAEKYDPEKGKFSVHASNWIKARIIKAIHKKGKQIRIPASQKDLQIPVGELDSSYQGITADKEFEFDGALKNKLVLIINKLDPKTALIVKMRFGFDGYGEHTVTEIASELENSPQAIAGRLRKGLAELKKYSNHLR